MPEKKEDERLNPQITTTEIGVRDLREITIYPLSMADQLKMTNLMKKALNDFFQRENQSDIAFASFLLEMIEKNLSKVLGMITDVKKNEDLFSDMTNLQGSEIAKIVYEVNYESAAKNLKDPFEKVKSLFQSKGLLLTSVSDIPSTDLKISTEEAGEKEE